MEVLNYIVNCFVSKQCILCGKIITEEINLYPVCSVCENKQKLFNGKICSICSYPLISENEKCMRCRDGSFNYLYNRSVFVYSGDIKELIYQYKFKNCKNLSYYFSKHLSNFLLNNYQECLIIPVPGRSIIKKQKGWEHIDLIASILKHKYKFPVQKLLTRKGKKAQKTLSRDKRAENLRKNIRFRKNIIKIPKTVILLDDVFTTGTTINECAGILKAAGIQNIYSLTIAID